MIEAIKEICIFVIIAQAVMFFVPENSYIKYVRILVGILMILKITEPVFGLLLDEEREKEMADRVMLLAREMDLKGGELKLEDNSMEIYESITEELISRLNDCESGYEVLEIEITKEQILIITVRRKEMKEKEDNKIQVEEIVIGEEVQQKSSMTKEEEQELKEIFGNCISMDAESIVILLKDR